MTFDEFVANVGVAHGHLEEFVDILVDIRDILQPYNETLSAAASIQTLGDMGVTLTVDGVEEDEWTQERIDEAYNAVMAIINRIAEDSDLDELFALILFKEVFGGTEIRLQEGNFEGSESYASTKVDGSVIYLYTEPTNLLRSDLTRCGEQFDIANPTVDNCLDAGYIPLHTEENIVHEFGHVLLFRNGGSDGAFFKEWDAIRIAISPFDTNQGWTSALFIALQNRSTQRDVELNNLSQTELENERIANMFEAWVYGRQPDLEGTEPQANQNQEQQQRRAWAMWTFMTGECPPPEVDVPCDETGFVDWISEFGGLR